MEKLLELEEEEMDQDRVSWDPNDGETMLGLQDSMGIPRPAWPEGIT
ncbi:hypothetical protein Tco_0458802, partial [Tanacetum coccineum]